MSLCARVWQVLLLFMLSPFLFSFHSLGFGLVCWLVCNLHFISSFLVSSFSVMLFFLHLNWVNVFGCHCLSVCLFMTSFICVSKPSSSYFFLAVKGRAISLKHILIALAQKSLLNCQVLRSFPSPIFQQDKQGFLFWLFSTSLLIHASSQREWRQVVFPRASSPAKSWSLTSSLSAVHAVRSAVLYALEANALSIFAVT